MCLEAFMGTEFSKILGVTSAFGGLDTLHPLSIVRDLVMEMFAAFEPPNMIFSLRRFFIE
jgi:hypothetical protein